MASTKISKKNNNILLSSFKKKCFVHTRFVFNGANIANGKEIAFFVELYILNPAISPKRPVLFSEVQGSSTLLPSYCAVRCGVLGKGGKELIKYNSLSEFIYDKKTGSIQIGSFSLTNEVLIGAVSTPDGTMDWNLQYERQVPEAPSYSSSKYKWNSDGVKTVVGGTIHYNGEEYQAVPNVSYGYSDFSSGLEQIDPWYHISASNLVSTINSKKLANSCFVVQKIEANKYLIFVKLEGKIYSVKTGNFIHKKCVECTCTESNDEQNMKRLHWSVSIHRGKVYIDIDVYCHESSMFLRTFDHPDGAALSNVLCGGTGVGEIRVYRKRLRTKTLELMESVRISNAICEYGSDKKL